MQEGMRGGEKGNRRGRRVLRAIWERGRKAHELVLKVKHGYL